MSAEKPLITRTDFVFLPVTSFKKAEEFYSGVLGLTCSARYKNDIGGEFETGSLTIQVVDSAKIGREFEPSKGAIALHVDDVAAACAELEARGVTFRGEIMDTASVIRHFSRIRTGTGSSFTTAMRPALNAQPTGCCWDGWGPTLEVG